MDGHTALTCLMDALTIARAAGLELKRQGSRWFVCSPFRNERTPSLCIFPDGYWYDFGGGQHGDAADLYAAIYHVPLGEALRIVNGGNWQPEPRKPSGNDLRRVVEAWKGEHWRAACAKKHSARATITVLENTEPDCEKFWQAVADEAAANDTLNLLAQATPRQLVHWMGGTI